MPYPTTDSNPNPKVERKMGYTRKKLHDLDERKKEAERRKAAVLATCAAALLPARRRLLPGRGRGYWEGEEERASQGAFTQPATPHCAGAARVG